jgi:hypothetical protein
MALSTSPTGHLTESCSFKNSRLNGDKFNNECVLKEILLACKNFDFLLKRMSGFTLDRTRFTSMVTGHNRFSVVAERGSYII